jgi:DNA-binding NtrC family response regulator
VEEIQRREPNLGVILMGAFLEPKDVPRAEALGAAFLTKPFELARMRALVRALVAAPDARASDLVDAAGG